MSDPDGARHHHRVDVRSTIVLVDDLHSANPAGAAKIAQVLGHWGYRVRVASGSTDVGYLDGPA